MRSSIFDAVLAARRDKKSVALVTELASGRQSLLMDGAYSGDLVLAADLEAFTEQTLESGISRLVQPDPANDESRHFVQVYAAPLRMIVIGGVHISQALIPMAQLAGYEVVLVDPRQAFANPDRFPNVEINNEWADKALAALAVDASTAVVALTHDPKVDEPALAAALASEAFYIGALGSRRTAAKRNERLAALGFSDTQLARIHGPVGLAIGAKSHAEIAISVIAQITTVLRGGAV
jgi:xanthine dehydrogenase accessory factor